MDPSYEWPRGRASSRGHRSTMPTCCAGDFTTLVWILVISKRATGASSS